MNRSEIEQLIEQQQNLKKKSFPDEYIDFSKTMPVQQTADVIASSTERFNRDLVSQPTEFN